MTKQLQPIFDGDYALVSQEQRKAVLDHLAEIGHDPRSRALSLNNLAAVDILIDDPGLVEEADEASRQAYETLPDLAAIRNTRGAALIAMGQLQAGIDLLEPTLGKTPPESLADSHLSLAHAHISLGRVYEGVIISMLPSRPISDLAYTSQCSPLCVASRLLSFGNLTLTTQQSLRTCFDSKLVEYL